MTEALTRAQLVQLFADLNPNRISNRKQGGATLSYLEAWDVRASLIRVFGFGGWSADVLPEGTKILRMDHDIPALDYKTKAQKTNPDGSPMFNFRVTAQAIVRLHIHQLGATYTEAAISSQTGPDVGEVGDFAIKTAESDALKRAAVNLGTTFGLSLYNSGATADVVRVSRAPGQTPRDMAAMEENEVMASMRPSSTAGQVPAGVNPDTGEVEDDAPMALSEEQVDAGRSAVADAFGGRQA